MKQLLATTLLTFGFSAFAMEPTECLVFSLRADHSYVEKTISDSRVKALISEGRKFGIHLVSSETSDSMTNYSLSYKRLKVLKSEVQKQSFDTLIRNFDFDVNSHIEYNFSCELEAPTPLPRISVTN